MGVRNLELNLCFHDITVCGFQNLTATTTEKSVEVANGPYYSSDSVCVYTFQASASNSAVYPTLNIIFDYFFAAEVYIVNGIDQFNATNETIVRKAVEYRLPLLGTGNSPNYVWVIIRPDNQT